MFRDKKGFTLIELLVVIAIIGILSSVVLASLNAARNRANDASVKSNLTQIRAQAELIADGGSYAAVCPTGTPHADISPMIAEATARATSAAQCVSGTDGWAAWAPLRNATGSNTTFCVDSTGKAEETTGGPSGSDVVCP